MFMLLLMLCGCEENTDINKNITAVDLTQVTEIKKNVDFGDIALNLETDSQNYFNTKAMVSVGTGYYYSVINEDYDDVLMYYDKENGVSLPVCQRTDCEHVDDNCDACFTSDMYYDEFNGELWYYENELYYLSSEQNDESITFILNTLSMDGSTRTIVREVCTQYYEGGGIISPVITLHRGYMYYVVVDGDGVSLYKSGIDEKAEPIELCRCAGFYNEIAGVQGFGDGVIFECVYSEEELEDILDVKGKLFYYNYETGELSLLAEGIIGGFAVTEDSVIYTDRKDMLMYNIANRTAKVIVTYEIDDASYDGNYIYLDNFRECINGATDWNKRKIDVYETDGTYVDTIRPFANDGISLFGDEDYFFMNCRGNDGEYVLYKFDKSQIGTGKSEWTKFE